MEEKLKLNLADIEVESFETTASGQRPDGTVYGASGVFSGAPDCYYSCFWGSCEPFTITCDDTCDDATCHDCGGGSGTNPGGGSTCPDTSQAGCEMCSGCATNDGCG